MLPEVDNNQEVVKVDIESEPPFKRYPGFKDWIYRLVIFLTGLVGLEIISIIAAIIIRSINPALLDEESESYINGLTMLNVIRYSILLLGLVFLLFPRLKIIFAKFKNYKHVLYGMGIAFLGMWVSGVYSSLLSLFIKMEENQNQSLAIDMVHQFPVLSIIVLGFFGPICEEFTYRYGLFACIKKKNRILAYIATIIIFAFIHFDFTGNMTYELLNLPSYMISGFALTLAYDLFGLEASISGHVLNNMVSIISIIIGAQ